MFPVGPDPGGLLGADCEGGLERAGEDAVALDSAERARAGSRRLFFCGPDIFGRIGTNAVLIRKNSFSFFFR